MTLQIRVLTRAEKTVLMTEGSTSKLSELCPNCEKNYSFQLLNINDEDVGVCNYCGGGITVV